MPKQRRLQPIYVIGYPSAVGGANTELWHTVKLWRRYGLPVIMIPTWRAMPEWRRPLKRIGVKIQERVGHELPVPEGATCVAWCNEHFERIAHQLQVRGCRLIYVPCMSYLTGTLINHHAKHGPYDRYVFQSHSQYETLLPQLAPFGVSAKRCRLIRGAFDPAEFPYHPRRQAGLIVGRLSRPDLAKFHRETWRVYGRVRRRIPETQVRIMGWGPKLVQHCGEPPGWAEVLKRDTESTPKFLRSLHVMAQMGDLAAGPRSLENWPRVGLEAMAAGVPIVADRRGGWKEMIIEGETGLLASSPEEATAHIIHLGLDEDARRKITNRAAEDLRDRLANPEPIWGAWQALLEGLT